MKRILILGGGASGMTAAIAAAEHAPKGTEVILLEQNPKPGKKLLATGNGRCNLDNSDCTVDFYFTSHRQLAAQMLQYIEKLDLPRWFSKHGLLCRATEDGRIYPYSNQAADVVQLLLYRMEQAGVQIHTDCRITDLAKKGSSYTVLTADGRKFYANAVICALGGNAGPQFGTEGFGIKLALRCGCQMEPLYPCLVPLKCSKEQVQGLSGIRVKADATLYDGNTALHTESGEIQFTDYGISGIAIMQLSGWLGKQHNVAQPEIRLNLFPQYTESELTTLLMDRAKTMPKASVKEYMIGLVHPKIGMAVWHAQKLGDENLPVSSLKKEKWQSFTKGLQQWTFQQLESTGWKNAQTTGGGVTLTQLEPDSFQSKDNPGLYFVGETTDCAGYCGGYNLHWAFGSGILAGMHAARIFQKES